MCLYFGTLKNVQMKVIFRRLISLFFGLLVVFGNLSFSPTKAIDETGYSETLENHESNYFGRKNITDGPYIFCDAENLTVKWICRNRVVEKKIIGDNYKVIKRNFGFDFNPNWMQQCSLENINYVQEFNDVENVIALSDIHGQYESLIKLLGKHNVIDRNFDWAFGDGHLVILGDILDRGPTVTEALWLLYRLEQQALESGGMVHVLLGNHELMVLNNDIRYIHEKYVKTSQLMATTYSQLYSKETILGKWLRNKPVIISINDMLFVHAGISPEFITNGLSKSQTNDLFINNIIGQTWETILHDSTLSFMLDDFGPIWYRGYFENPNLTELQIDKILHYFKVNHIIVGHTSMPNIVSLFNGKIYGIDSNIKWGDYGELLIYNQGEYYRGTITGTILKM